jgi:hypothetical protein
MRPLAVACLIAGCGRLGFDAAGKPTGDAAEHGDGANTGDGAGSASGGPRQVSPAVLGTGSVTITLPAPTTPGTLLVATLGLNNLSVTPPPNWMLNANGTVSGACTSAIATDRSGTGGQQSFTFTLPGGAVSAIQVSEWGGIDLGNPIDAAGFGGGLQPATALTITTMSAATVPGELAIGTFCQDTTMPSFTPGAGWTELGQAANTSASPSLLGEYQLGVPSAQITATGTSSISSKYAATVMTFRTL